MSKIDQINTLLPQTQCGQCGFKGCRPYAEAIALGQVEINRCAPGGEDGIRALAQLLGVEPNPLNPEFGEHKPRSVALIIEEECIGCVKCINVCPVDAIVGAAKLMHTVIFFECTGCALCVEPCPVDCIVMKPLPNQEFQGSALADYRFARSQLAMVRYESRCLRKEQERADDFERRKKQKEALLHKNRTKN